MTPKDRSKPEADRPFTRVAVNILLPLTAFMVGQVAVLSAGVFTLVFHPVIEVPMALALAFVPIGSLALLATIHLMLVFMRERARLLEREGRDPVR